MELVLTKDGEKVVFDDVIADILVGRHNDCLVISGSRIENVSGVLGLPPNEFLSGILSHQIEINVKPGERLPVVRDVRVGRVVIPEGSELEIMLFDGSISSFREYE